MSWTPGEPWGPPRVGQLVMERKAGGAPLRVEDVRVHAGQWQVCFARGGGSPWVYTDWVRPATPAELASYQLDQESGL